MNRHILIKNILHESMDQYAHVSDASSTSGQYKMGLEVDEGLNLQKKQPIPLDHAMVGDILYCKALYPGISKQDLHADPDVWDVFTKDFTVGRKYEIIGREDRYVTVINNTQTRHNIIVKNDNTNNWGFGFKSSDFFDAYKGSNNINEGLNLPKKSATLARIPEGTAAWSGNWNASIGDLETSYQNLVAAFGEPDIVETDTYDVEWEFKYGDINISIHNWKNGPNYLGNNGTPVEEIESWSVICSVNPVPQDLIRALTIKSNGAFFKPDINVRVI